MNILYIGALMIPIRDLLEGKTENEITGHPAYFWPCYKLIQQGHNIDFIFFPGYKGEYNLKVDWLKKENIVVNINTDEKKKTKLHHIISMINMYIKLFYLTNKVIKKRNYDFIYCFDYPALFGNIIANIHNIPCGMRVFGDGIIIKGKNQPRHEFIKTYSISALRRNKPLLWFAYKIRKDFILVTDDGAQGDTTYQLLKARKNKYRFFFWKTGIDKSYTPEENNLPLYICFSARITEAKRQDRVIKVLYALHQKGYRIHAYIIGKTDSIEYMNKLNSLVCDYGLSSYVHFTGAISQNKLKDYAYNAIANILMADYSNLGNVFYEIMSVGGIVVGINDGSLEAFLKSGENGFLINNEEQAAAAVIRLIQDKILRENMQIKARMTSEDSFLSLEDRFDKEVELIISCAKGEDISTFPDVL